MSPSTDWFIDIDEYLPQATLQWCKAVLHQLGYLDEITGEDYFEDGERVHCHAYLELREAVRAHMHSGALPHLDELKTPPKYRDYCRSRQYEEALVARGVDLTLANGVVDDNEYPLAGEGPDEGITAAEYAVEIDAGDAGVEREPSVEDEFEPGVNFIGEDIFD